MTTINLYAGDYLVFAIDCTGSMQTRDANRRLGELSRMDYAMDRVLNAFEMCEASQPGWSADVMGFGSQLIASRDPITTGYLPDMEFFRQLTATHASTLTHEVIFAAHSRRLTARNREHCTLVLITDGAPSSPEATVAALQLALSDSAERRMEVHFLTVGEPDEDLLVWLNALQLHQEAQPWPSGVVRWSRLEDTSFMFEAARGQVPLAPGPENGKCVVHAQPAPKPAQQSKRRGR